MKPTGANSTLCCLLVAAVATTGHVSPRAVRAGRRVEVTCASAGNWSSGTKHGCCGPRQSYVIRIPDAGSSSHQAEDADGSATGVELVPLPVVVAVPEVGWRLDWPCAAGPSRSLTLRQLEVRLNV